MKIKVIKTEEEYEKALKHLESLMDAAVESPEEEKLDLLSLLINNFEEEHYAIDLPDPIEAIKFRMDQQGLSQKDMQKYLGSQSKVSEVLNYKRPLSLPMIRSLNEGLGIPAEVLVQEPGKGIPDEKYSLSDYPFTVMFKRGYFKGFQGTLYKAKDYSETLMNELFSVFSEDLPEHVYCRYSDKEIDKNALMAWHARALHMISVESVPKFSRDILSKTFFKEVISLSFLSNGPQLVKEFLNKKGIHFIILEHLPKTYLDGACFKSPDGSPVIGLTLRYDRLDNFWFTLAHELAHLYLHLDDGNKAFFDDTDQDKNKIKRSCESEADKFALEILIPNNIWKDVSNGILNDPDPQDIIEIANRLSVSPSILAGRVRWEKNNFFILNDLLGNGSLRSQLITQ